MVGIYDMKARLSEICEQVARTHEPVTITRRGRPLVRIDPIESAVMTIRERRDVYMAGVGKAESGDGDDFEVPERRTDVSAFRLDDKS